MLTSARTTIRRAISHRAGAPAWWGGKRICKITCDLVPTNRRPELQLLIRVEVGNGPFAKLWELHTAHWRPHAHGAAPVPSRRVHPLSQSSGLIRPRQRGCLGRILMLASSGGDKADRRLKSYAPILCTSLTHVPMPVVDQWSPTKCLPPLHQRASKKVLAAAAGLARDFGLPPWCDSAGPGDHAMFAIERVSGIAVEDAAVALVKAASWKKPRLPPVISLYAFPKCMTAGTASEWCTKPGGRLLRSAGSAKLRSRVCRRVRQARGSQMATLTEQIEQLRLQIKQVAVDEHALVKELSDSLRQADKQLLAEVRLAAAEHEARRSTIVGELDALASRIGVFPQQRRPRLLLMMNCVIYYRQMSRVHRRPPSNYGERSRPRYAAVN